MKLVRSSAAVLAPSQDQFVADPNLR